MAVRGTSHEHGLYRDSILPVRSRIRVRYTQRSLLLFRIFRRSVFFFCILIVLFQYTILRDREQVFPLYYKDFFEQICSDVQFISPSEEVGEFLLHLLKIFQCSPKNCFYIICRHIFRYLSYCTKGICRTVS